VVVHTHLRARERAGRVLVHQTLAPKDLGIPMKAVGHIGQVETVIVVTMSHDHCVGLIQRGKIGLDLLGIRPNPAEGDLPKGQKAPEGIRENPDALGSDVQTSHATETHSECAPFALGMVEGKLAQGGATPGEPHRGHRPCQKLPPRPPVHVAPPAEPHRARSPNPP
jgi:hypothetical protein